MTTKVANFAAKPVVSDNVKRFYYEKISSSSLFPRPNDDPITFSIPSIEGMFIDLNQIYMTTKFRVRKRDANGEYVNIEDTDNVAPYNNFLQSQFAELEVEFNAELVSTA